MLELTDIIYFLLAFIAGHFWWQTMQARERAEKIAQAACKQENMQILDVTVSLKKFGFEKDRHGNRVFLRYFNFEFSKTGEERLLGTIAMRGSVQQYLHMDLPDKPTIHLNPTEFSNGKFQQHNEGE